MPRQADRMFRGISYGWNGIKRWRNERMEVKEMGRVRFKDLKRVGGGWVMMDI